MKLKYIIRSVKMSKIKKIYDSLSHIIYLNKYLIQNKPKKPPSFMISLQQNISQIIKMQKLKMKKSQAIKIYNRHLIQNNPIYIQTKQKSIAQFQQYKLLSQEYKEKYLDPPKVMIGAFSLFLAKMQKEGGQGKSMKELSEMFNSLKEEEKSQLSNEVGNERKKRLPRYEMYIKQHEIPYYTRPNSYQIFLSESYSQALTTQQKKALHMKFQALSEQKKQEYRQKAKRLQEVRKKEFKQFLNRWKLTQKQFSYIKQVCQLYNNEKKQKKITKKVLKQIKMLKDKDKEKDIGQVDYEQIDDVHTTDQDHRGKRD